MTETPVAAVLFDLDGTLCEYERPGSAVLDHAFDRVGVDPFFEIGAYYDRFDAHVSPNRSLDEIRESAFAAIAQDAGRDAAVGRDVATAYARERDYRRVRPLPAARELVAEIAAAYPVGLVTNGPAAAQQPKLETLSLTDAFDTVVFAGFETPPKPDREPFDRALADLDASPAETIYVGNSLAHDVVGAHRAGLASVWLDGGGTTTPDPRPDHRIGDLADLRTLLDRLTPA